MAAKSKFTFYFWHIVLPVGLFALVLLLVVLGNLDRRLTDLFFDPTVRSFPWRDTWLLQAVEHVAAKEAVMLLGIMVLAIWMASHWTPRLDALRPILLYIFISMLLSVLSVSSLRYSSTRHCPYDLVQYGGPFAETGGPFETLPVGMDPGRCWPSAHASAGFCLFAWYFAAFEARRRRLAAWLLAATIAFGSILSIGRVAQGAHFISHCIWSAIICWFVSVATYEALLRRRPIPVHSPSLKARRVLHE